VSDRGEPTPGGESERSGGVGAATAVLVALNQRYSDTWPPGRTVADRGPRVKPRRIADRRALIAMIGAGLLTRSRLPIERRLE